MIDFWRLKSWSGSDWTVNLRFLPIAQFICFPRITHDVLYDLSPSDWIKSFGLINSDQGWQLER